MAAELISIPTSDIAFRHFVQRTLAKTQAGSPADLERQLRRTYPRVLVRERGLTGELPAWYVYRDGAWRASDADAWWEDVAVPRLEASSDGWIRRVNPPAAGVLGIEADGTEGWHFTDFVAPGGLDDAMALFEIVRSTGTLEATIVLQPTTGDAIAVDMRVTTGPQGLVAVFRLAADVETPGPFPVATPPERIEYVPRTDVAFRAYAMRSLARMPEPTPDGLALRLRRLYPHSQVEAGPEGWLVRRDRESDATPRAPWWEAPQLPRVRYDREALILEANGAAVRLFGRTLVGHHWQEFVTAGSTEEVAIMLDILAEAGAAESRFRMPRGDGTLLEFDSYTTVAGDEFVSVYRPVSSPGELEERTP
jgi:PAS domain-containing protein